MSSELSSTNQIGRQAKARQRSCNYCVDGLSSCLDGDDLNALNVSCLAFYRLKECSLYSSVIALSFLSGRILITFLAGLAAVNACPIELIWSNHQLAHPFHVHSDPFRTPNLKQELR